MSIIEEKLLTPGGALDRLAELDSDIASALDRFGPPADRSLPASFETLARSVIGQQISRSAASSIWTRMQYHKCNTDRIISAKKPEEITPLGLSRRKAEYLIGIAKEIHSGRLNLQSLAGLGGDEVQKRLVEIRGIGEWTADNFRLFALGDMDAWPFNDLALRESMKWLKGLNERPNSKIMQHLGEPWRPYRGAGALMLWHIYGVLVRKATINEI